MTVEQVLMSRVLDITPNSSTFEAKKMEVGSSVRFADCPRAHFAASHHGRRPLTSSDSTSFGREKYSGVELRRPRRCLGAPASGLRLTMVVMLVNGWARCSWSSEEAGWERTLFLLKCRGTGRSKSGFSRVARLAHAPALFELILDLTGCLPRPTREYQSPTR